MTYEGSTHHYTYDAEGNIVQADSGSTGTYVYDALNHRVQGMTSGNKAIEFVFDVAGRITSYWTPVTTAVQGNIYADNTQIAFRAGDGNTYFNHKNWLNTDRVHTDLNGAAAAVYTSLPWGDNSTDTVYESDGGWDFSRFGDIDYDQESNTYHAPFRQYSQAQARWMSPDPYDGSYDASNPQSFNRYAYVLNNPLSFTDPSGQDACLATIAGGSEAGPIGTGIGVGACIAELLGAGKLIEDLFGFGAPSFHGSVQPRPNAQPWDEYNNYFSHGSIAAALGLPDESCEFGACGAGPSGFQAAGGAVAGTIVCQFAEPCGAIEDSLLVIGAIGVAGYDIYQMSQHGSGNQADTGVMQDVYRLYPNLPVCQALDFTGGCGQGKHQKAGCHQCHKKAYGCKRSRASR